MQALDLRRMDELSRDLLREKENRISGLKEVRAASGIRRHVVYLIDFGLRSGLGYVHVSDEVAQCCCNKVGKGRSEGLRRGLHGCRRCRLVRSCVVFKQ